MGNKQLSGIERELVLQYLIDGNVPVTITPIENNLSEEKIHSVNSQIFPIAIRPEHIKVKDNGEILLENPTQNILKFINQDVKVEFYFNRVGLFFISRLQATQNGICIVLPDVIDRITDVEEIKQYDFSAKIYYDFKNKKELNTDCYPWEYTELFKRPMWKTIPLENQQKAKVLLEKMVEEAKIEKNIGNGIQLIPICNYLTFNHSIVMDAMENRIHPCDILYVDHERIIIAGDSKAALLLEKKSEYGLKISFSLKKGPIKSRDIFVTFIVNKTYQNNEFICFDCCYSTLQEEDLRFLYEKTTSSLFI